jgi:hypothetical protein
MGSLAKRLLKRSFVAMVVFITGIAHVALAPPASAEDTVTYEIVSETITAANVEYYDRSMRISQQRVALPWRITVAVVDARSPTGDGAEIRADWRGYGRWRYKYVTVRIYLRGELLCESTLDVGNATCYGSVPHRNFPQTAGG